MSTVRIENHHGRIFQTPPTHSFPMGINLLPGLNTVPQKYMDEMLELEGNTVTKTIRKGGKVTEVELEPVYPGKRFVEYMEKNVLRVTAEGKSFGPSWTVYKEALVDREDGPPPPATLPAKEAAALAIVNACDDRKYLEQWLKLSKGPVAAAIRTKLGQLAVAKKEVFRPELWWQCEQCGHFHGDFPDAPETCEWCGYEYFSNAADTQMKFGPPWEPLAE